MKKLLFLLFFPLSVISQNTGLVLLRSTSGAETKCKIIGYEETKLRIELESGQISSVNEDFIESIDGVKAPECFKQYRKLANLLRFAELNGTKEAGYFEAYQSKSGFVYSVGDTLKVGKPSGVNGKFVYFQKLDLMGTQYVVGAEAANTNAIIKKIYINGSARTGWKAAFQTKGFTFVDNYFLNIEDAIEAGEVKSMVKTSDEALAELKKAKDKLDLELISQEEYNMIKEELRKFIK